jgi:hypothetical protein
MKDFTSLKFEMWCNYPSDDRNPPQEMVAIKGQRGEEGNEGLRYVWFVLSRTEFQDLLTGKRTTAEDGYHQVVVHGDSWLFYDMESLGGRRKSGTFSVPFYRANMPRTFMRAVLRLCKKTWKLLANGYKDCIAAKGNKYDLPHRIEIVVSKEHRERIERLYGQGLGNVRIDFGDYKAEEAKVAFDNLMENGGEGDRSFRSCVEGRIAIVKNSTWGFHQTGTLRLFYRGPNEFDWAAINPQGKAFYNGGIINHGRDGGNDWASHT